jgi:hypothetical protein
MHDVKITNFLGTKKKRKYLKGIIKELETNSENKTIRPVRRHKLTP